MVCGWTCSGGAAKLVDGRRGKAGTVRQGFWLMGEEGNGRRGKAGRRRQGFWLMGEEGKLGAKMRGFAFRIFYFITKILKCLKSHVLSHFN